jgi:hypothetical protein
MISAAWLSGLAWALRSVIWVIVYLISREATGGFAIALMSLKRSICGARPRMPSPK